MSERHVGAAAEFGPHERAVLAFLDRLARLPMGRVPELVELASERDAAVVRAARREAARAVAAAGLEDAVARSDELVRRWATGLLADDRLGVPGYDTQAAALQPGERAAAADVARDTLLALTLGDLLEPAAFDVLLAPWHAFLSPTAAVDEEGRGAARRGQ